MKNKVKNKKGRLINPKKGKKIKQVEVQNADEGSYFLHCKGIG